LAHVLPRKQAISRWYSFSPHLTSASTLSEKSSSSEIASFHLSAVSLLCQF